MWSLYPIYIFTPPLLVVISLCPVVIGKVRKQTPSVCRSILWAAHQAPILSLEVVDDSSLSLFTSYYIILEPHKRVESVSKMAHGVFLITCSCPTFPSFFGVAVIKSNKTLGIYHGHETVVPTSIIIVCRGTGGAVEDGEARGERTCGMGQHLRPSARLVISCIWRTIPT